MFQSLEGQGGQVAVMLGMAYFADMLATRLLRIMVMLAMLLAPAGMLGSHAAMATPTETSAAAMDPCDTQKHAPDKDQAMIDCAIACSAMPATADAARPQRLLISPEYRLATTLHSEGRRPPAATPPPPPACVLNALDSDQWRPE